MRRRSRCVGRAVHRRESAVALVLNRADWLAEFGYTIAEAIERGGQEWASVIPQIARQLADEEDA